MDERDRGIKPMSEGVQHVFATVAVFATLGWIGYGGLIWNAENSPGGWGIQAQFVLAFAGCLGLWAAYLVAEKGRRSLAGKLLLLTGVIFGTWLVLIASID